MLLTEFYKNIEGDYENIKGRLRSDAIIEKFVKKFLDEKSYEEMMAAANANDVQETISTSHKLKGVTANLSFDKLCNILTELLVDLRKENQTEVNMELIEKAKECYEYTIQMIKEL